MHQIKQVKKNYIKWFTVTNIGFIAALFAMNLCYNFILDRNLWKAAGYTVISVLVIYLLAGFYFLLTSSRLRKWGAWLMPTAIILLFLTSRSVIYDILPQWDSEVYGGTNKTTLREYVLIMIPRFFYYSFIALAIALNIRMGFQAIRGMKIEIEKIEADKTAKEMELRAWGAYTDPHFLHNELRNVAHELVLADSDGKRAFLEKRLNILADISVYNSKNVFNDRRIVVFSKELQQLEKYLESRDTGTESYLKPVLEVQGESMGHKIVPMTLVYLAEGAFKHGDLLAEPLHIQIRLMHDRSEIRFRNRIASTAKTTKSLGSGLSIVRRRLELAMPERFTWRAAEHGPHFEVAITIQS